jgi:hypothetical protein
VRDTGQAGSVDTVRSDLDQAPHRGGLCARGGGVSEVGHPIHLRALGYGVEVLAGSTSRERDRRGPGILRKRFGEAGEAQREKTRLKWR